MTEPVDLRVVASDSAAALRRLLAAIEVGEISSSAAVTYRIQGAVIALDALVGGESPDLAALTTSVLNVRDPLV